MVGFNAKYSQLNEIGFVNNYQCKQKNTSCKIYIRLIN